MQSSAKENPNPVVHTTQRSTTSTRSSLSQSLGYEAIRRYNLGAPSPTISSTLDESSPFLPSSYYLSVPPTAEEHSVAIALSEAAYPPSSSASDSPLDVLQRAGFALFHPQRIHKECRAIRFPAYSPASVKSHTPQQSSLDSHHKRDEITSEEVFDIIRNIQDPEHPLTLEQLNVVRMDMVDVVDLSVANDDATGDQVVGQKRKFSKVHVQFCPTIPHCSMATLIGLSISVKLLRSLPPRFKVLVKIEPGTHVSEHAINKQLADKERVRAALENDHLLGVVNRCIAGGMTMQ
ncbi:hypothetical protein ACHAXM_002394 [Skeletonema potamos]|jgi:metal-sulfur cluster biosynthetic enzyme